MVCLAFCLICDFSENSVHLTRVRSPSSDVRRPASGDPKELLLPLQRDKLISDKSGLGPTQSPSSQLCHVNANRLGPKINFELGASLMRKKQQAQQVLPAAPPPNRPPKAQLIKL